MIRHLVSDEPFFKPNHRKTSVGVCVIERGRARGASDSNYAQCYSVPNFRSRSSYVNVSWPDDLTPGPLQSALDTVGAYRADIEACLHGLAQENRWFADESGLVPTGLFKRKSDDILLTSTASRAKPTTAAELRLDNRFWLGLSSNEDGSESYKPIESTPSWLKSKWAELEVNTVATLDVLLLHFPSIRYPLFSAYFWFRL